MFKKILMAAALFGLMAAAVPQEAKAKGPAAHHVVFQINSDDPKLMNLVLNNVQNVNNAYKEQGKAVEIEIVAYGPGLTMLVNGKSPVTARIQDMSAGSSNIAFSACGNTMKKMSKKSGKPVELLDFTNVKVVPAGVIRIIELQDAGYHYIKP